MDDKIRAQLERLEVHPPPGMDSDMLKQKLLEAEPRKKTSRMKWRRDKEIVFGSDQVLS